MKPHIIKISLLRAEGPTSLCSKTPVEFSGPTLIENAQTTLNTWGTTAPEPNNGYHKCDVHLWFSDQREGTYRYDLEKGGTSDRHTLAEHINLWTAGLA